KSCSLISTINCSNPCATDVVGCIKIVAPGCILLITRFIITDTDGFCQSIVSTVHKMVAMPSSSAILTTLSLKLPLGGANHFGCLPIMASLISLGSTNCTIMLFFAFLLIRNAGFYSIIVVYNLFFNLLFCPFCHIGMIKSMVTYQMSLFIYHFYYIFMFLCPLSFNEKSRFYILFFSSPYHIRN